METEKTVFLAYLVRDKESNGFSDLANNCERLSDQFEHNRENFCVKKRGTLDRMSVS